MHCLMKGFSVANSLQTQLLKMKRDDSEEREVRTNCLCGWWKQITL